MSITIDGVPFIANIKRNDSGLESYEYADGSKHTIEYDKNGEVQLAQSIFGNTINYNRVDIYQKNWAGALYVPYMMTLWNVM